MPQSARHARQVVLLVVDGLGWEQLRARSCARPDPVRRRGDRPRHHLGGPDHHGLGPDIDHHRPPAVRPRDPRLPAGGTATRSSTCCVGPSAAAGPRCPPDRRRPAVPALPPFAGSSRPVPVVSKDEFGGTGFTAAHLGDSPLRGYRVPSSLPVEVGRLLGRASRSSTPTTTASTRSPTPTGWAITTTPSSAPWTGWWAIWSAVLPAGAVLVVTADHGQIEVGPQVEMLGREVMAMVRFFSGEGRFRWMHARARRGRRPVEHCRREYGDTTWVRTGTSSSTRGCSAALPDENLARLGDVALIPHAPSPSWTRPTPGRTGWPPPRLPDRRRDAGPLGGTRRWQHLSDGYRTPETAATDARPPARGRRPTRTGRSPRPGAAAPRRPAMAGDRRRRRAAPSRSSSRPSCCASARWSSSCWRRSARRRSTRPAGAGCARSTSSRSASWPTGCPPTWPPSWTGCPSPSTPTTPSEAELRVAHAQLVGWLEGLFHGIQATLVAQQVAARAQLDEMRQRSLTGGPSPTDGRPGTYL